MIVMSVGVGGISQRLGVAVVITNGPVCMCERVAYGRGGSGVVRVISDVIYT